MGSMKNTFEEVLSDFKSSLKPKELESFQFVSLNDVRETALRIQRDQENLKTVLNMARIESFLEAMEQFGKVIDTFVNASSFVAFVWGPLKFILQTASTWADTFEILMDAYGQIGEHMPLVEQYEDFFGNSPHMRRILPLVYADILSFHKRAIRFVRGKPAVWRQIFRSAWKDYGTRFKSILDSLKRHRELVVEQAALLHYEQSQSDSQQMLLHIQKYEQHRSETLTRLQEQEEAEMRKKYHDVLEWFSAAQTTEKDHLVFRETRSQCLGSGEWILRDEKVRNWMELETPVSSILWINGIPGAGKTILASTIIDACAKNTEYCTTYFYCKENDEEKNDCISIYRGVLCQFLKQCQELVAYCYDKSLTSGEISLTTSNLAEQLLRLFCEKISKQYVIIDGLDECDLAQRKLLLAFFAAMVEKCDERDPGKLRVLVVSQDFPDIEKALRTSTILKLTVEDNKNDIKNYVHERCKEIQVKYDLYGDKLEAVGYIEETTCIRAHGMFLFAKLVMENLHAQETQKDLLYEIQAYRFPQLLEDAYDRILGRLKRSLLPPQWRIARELFGWMVCAQRPLQWREIQAVVTMDSDAQTFEFESRKLRSDIQDYCGSLIQVLPGQRIELVHTTAKMYITRTEWFHKLPLECHLASSCLRYLTFECFDEDISPERLQELTFKGHLSLQDYAAAKWLEHVRAIVKMTPDSFSADPEPQKALEELAAALEDFTGCYDMEMLKDKVTSAAEQDCKRFQNYEIYVPVLQVWNHIHRHHEKGLEKRNDISIERLSEAFFRNRKILESFPASNSSFSGDIGNLTTFYGEKLFKCPKITCFYFHEGFKDAKSRDRHINRHDRPYKCTVPDCTIVEFGFPSNKDMEKHVRFFHPEAEHEANAFVIEKKPPGATPWECNICHKKFTRGFHQRNHTRSHTGEKPFACSECGRAFTRANDCKRHEKLHSRR